MVELDGDDVRISSRGKLAERDIVQVKLIVQPVPLTRLTSHFLLGGGGGVSGKGLGGSLGRSQSSLAPTEGNRGQSSVIQSELSLGWTLSAMPEPQPSLSHQASVAACGACRWLFSAGLPSQGHSKLLEGGGGVFSAAAALSKNLHCLAS